MLRKLKCIFLSCEGVQEQYAKENIWTQEGGCNGDWRNCVMRNFIIGSLCLVEWEWSVQED